jgi:hypothetical protein
VIVLPEITEAEETLIVEVVALIAPGVTVTAGSVEVTALPPTVAPIVVAVPATAPVNVAE